MVSTHPGSTFRVNHHLTVRIDNDAQMAPAAGSAGPQRLTDADRAATAQVLDALWANIAVSDRSMRQLAAAAGCHHSTMSRWRTGQVVPRIGHLIAVGIQTGFRLEWFPSSADWPGADLPPTTIRPDPGMWPGPQERFKRPRSDDEITYLGSLIGAEIRWWRTQIANDPLWKMPTTDLKTWLHLELGPRHNPNRWDKQRLISSVPLSTAVFAGRYASLTLQWVATGSPWRVRPWEAATGSSDDGTQTESVDL